MAQELIDITGNEYGFLKVIGFSHIGNRRRSYWECQCTRCGKIVTLRKDDFAYTYSKVKSCGCYHDDVSRERMNKNRNPATGRIEVSV